MIFSEFYIFCTLEFNQISNFQDRFPDYFLRNAMKELPPFNVLKPLNYILK